MGKKMFIIEVFPERSVSFQPLSLGLKQELISVGPCEKDIDVKVHGEACP